MLIGVKISEQRSGNFSNQFGCWKKQSIDLLFGIAERRKKWPKVFTK
jgi:hypothetical protein